MPCFRSSGRIAQVSIMVLLAEKAKYLYGSYPSLMQNELTRYMGGLLRNQAYGACRQQGLLHIYYTWCRTRECAACPVAMLRKTIPV